MLKDNPFPLPKHIDSFFFPHEQTSALCLYKTHIDLSLPCVCEHKYKHNHKFYVYVCVYVLMYVYVYMCVCVRQLFTLVKLHATERRWLILWERVPLLSAVQTVVIPRARGGRKSLMSSNSSQSALLVHPSWVGVFYSDHLPSPGGWSGEGSVPVPMWQRGTSQGLLPAPRKTSLEWELWWQTSSCRQSRFSCQRLCQGDQKWVCISISHHHARMAQPKDPYSYRQEKKTKPTPCKPPLLLSVC